MSYQVLLPVVTFVVTFVTVVMFRVVVDLIRK